MFSTDIKIVPLCIVLVLNGVVESSKQIFDSCMIVEIITMSLNKKQNNQVMNNQRRNNKIDPKILSSISSLITQNSRNINSKANRNSKKKGKVLTKGNVKNNLQNKDFIVPESTIKKRKKKVKQSQNESNTKDSTNEHKSDIIKNKNKRNLKRLQNKPTFKLDQQTENKGNKGSGINKQVKKDLLNVKSKHIKISSSNNSKVNIVNSLRERMQNQLKSSQFRYLNEQLYTTEGKEAKQFFQSDRDSFEAYHEGFRQQVSKWPMNPLDKIITAVKKMPVDHVIADFGCGEAKLARSIPHKVHSFDLVETVPGVVACDMAHCKLPAGTVDVAVYCLSLMGTNLRDYLAEANRVLKKGGILKIAEVESRFDRIENFIQGLQKFGFKFIWKDLSHNLFYFLDFKKERTIKNKNKLPTITLNPCLYKKR